MNDVKTRVVGKIPTTVYLRKFAEFLEDVEPGQPLDLGSGGIVPKFIKSLLVGKKELWLDFPREDLHDKNDEIRYIVDEKMLDSGIHFISRRHINAFNSFLFSQFHSMLLFKIRLEMKKGFTEKDIILDYMQLIGLDEEEYSMSSIKRQITRLRSSKHMPSLRNKKGFYPY